MCRIRPQWPGRRAGQHVRTAHQGGRIRRVHQEGSTSIAPPTATAPQVAASQSRNQMNMGTCASFLSSPEPPARVQRHHDERDQPHHRGGRAGQRGVHGGHGPDGKGRPGGCPSPSGRGCRYRSGAYRSGGGARSERAVSRNHIATPVARAGAAGCPATRCSAASASRQAARARARRRSGRPRRIRPGR